MSQDKTAAEAGKKRRRRWWSWRVAGIVLLVLIALLVAARLALPWAVRQYVNRTLDRNLLYEGKIGDVSIHLWRGGYSIEDVKLDKTTGNVPVPFFAAKRVDLAIEWHALLRGKLVGRVWMDHPQLNMVDANDESETQTGAGGPWLQMIRDLFPFRINSTQVHEGEIHFRAFDRDPPVDVYLDHLEATIANLTNIQDDTAPLIATVDAKALAMDQANFEFHMKFDPFSYRPTFHLATRLIGLDVTQTNALARAYGAFDFQKGWFDLVIEMDAKEGQVEGYVKPLFRNIQVLSLAKDVPMDNPLEFFWEAVVGVTTQLLKNQPRDQFGTLIPFRGSIDQPATDILAAIGNVLRNAFVRAYLPRLQKPSAVEGVATDGIQFSPGEITDRSTPGEGS